MAIIREPGVGERLGTGLSQGISQSLQMLAQHKLGELSQRQTQSRKLKGLEALFPPQIAQALSQFDERTLQPILKDVMEGPQKKVDARRRIEISNIKIAQANRRMDQADTNTKIRIEENIIKRERNNIAKASLDLRGGNMEKDWAKVGVAISKVAGKVGIVEMRKLKLETLNRVKRGLITSQEAKQKFISEGLGEGMADAFVNNNLTDELINYFLKKSGNSYKKAEQMAKSFGFEV